MAVAEATPIIAAEPEAAYDFTLKPHPTICKAPGPVLVCILDGWGENEFKDEFNAVHSAHTPTTDAFREVPGRWRTVKAHGTAVGLPSDADMGNSEVGHNALGSGQVVDQGARLVDIALETGDMWEGDGFKLVSQAFESNTLHLIGLLSDGGVHSRANQLHGIIRGSVERGCKRVRVHILTDGRDVPDGSSVRFVAELEGVLKEVSDKGADAKIASGGGRMNVTMDRYEGTEDKPVSDQNLEPFVIVDAAGAPVGTVEDGDAVVLFNFRADRMVAMSKAFEYSTFTAFERQRFPQGLRFVGMMQYDGDLHLPANYLVSPPEILHVSGEYLARNKISTFACSETQKFGHVTFFWNGNRSGFFDESMETYVEIPSDKIQFNLAPDMKAKEITAAGKEALRSGRFQMVRINYANPDMVGHTGDLAATTATCALVDKCVAELMAVCDEVNGRWLLTSDHGNADDMVQRDKKGKPLYGENGKALPLTSHTLAPVPVMIGGKGLPANVMLRTDLPGAGLSNITATTLSLLGYETPSIYQPSLIESV